MQVLGRNLEGLVSRAQEQRTQWKDSHVSVEHLVLAFLDDTRFGAQLLKNAGLDLATLSKAIKEIRGSNRVTDQARAPLILIRLLMDMLQSSQSHQTARASTSVSRLPADLTPAQPARCTGHLLQLVHAHLHPDSLPFPT